jgi:hypothetical protein
MAYPGFDAQDPSFYDGFGGQMPFSGVPHEHHAVEESSKDKPHLGPSAQQSSSQSHNQNQPQPVQSSAEWENERSAQGVPAPLGPGIGMGMSGMGMGMPGPYAPAMSLGPQFGAGMYGYPPYGYPAPGQFGGFPPPPAQAPRQQHGPQQHHAPQHGGHHQHHAGHLAQQPMPMNFPPQFMQQFSKFQGPVGFEDDPALGYGFNAEPSQHPQQPPANQHQAHGSSHLGGMGKQQSAQSGDHGKSFAMSQQPQQQQSDYPPYMQQPPTFPFQFAPGFGQPNMPMNPPNVRQ